MNASPNFPVPVPSPSKSSIEFSSWSQTQENIELRLNVSTNCCYIFVEDHKITIKTLSGSEWMCRFYKKVIRESSTAFLKSGLLTVKIRKHLEYEWLFYNMTENIPLHARRIFEEFSDCDDSDQEELPTNVNTPVLPSTGDDGAFIKCGNMDINDLQASAGDNSSIISASTISEYSYKSATLVLLEVSNRTIRLFLFAYGIGKESVKVDFGKKRVLVFHSCDDKLPEECERSKRQTTFSIDISLEEDILEKQCKTKIVPINSIDNVIEMVLVKKELKMWNVASVAMRDDSHIQKQKVVYKSRNLFSTTIVPSDKEESLSVVTNTTKPTCTVLPITPTHFIDETNYETTGQRARVHPLMLLEMTSIPQKPGFVGLKNIGNTCFINCVLQVLANTVELKNYFLEKIYKTHLNVSNPLGMGGKLASAFAQVVSILWRGTLSSFCPSKLKNLIGQKQNRFHGSFQHDAEEFMEFLLDGLHEDLNRIINKPYTQEPPDYSSLDSEAAAHDAWLRHKLRNDSFIVDLFQGQYRSKLTCSTCGKASVTFDPFSVVQVPIPKKKRPITVVLLSKQPNLKPLQYHLQIEMDATVRSLLFQLCKINKNLRISDLRVFEIEASKVQKTCTLACGIPASSESLLVCEVISQDMIGEPVVEVLIQQKTAIPVSSCIKKGCHTCRKDNLKSRRCSRCYKVSYCDQDCQKKDWPQHKLDCKREDSLGCPFVISLPQSMVTYQKILEIAEAYASYSVHVFHPPLECSQLCSESTASDGSGDHHLTVTRSMKDKGVDAVNNLDYSFEKSFEMTAAKENNINPEKRPKLIRQVLATQQDLQIRTNPPFILCSPPSTSTYDFVSKRNINCFTDEDKNSVQLGQIKELFMIWKNSNDDKSDNYVLVESKPLDCDIVTSQSEINRSDCSAIQLRDCFDLFTEPELLDPTPSWYCSQCKMERRATKEISLWRLPHILVVHLKRFLFTNLSNNNKIEDFVHFPTRGLDMSPYSKGGTTEQLENEQNICQSAFNPNDFQSSLHSLHSQPACHAEKFENQSSPTLYDLYGVINHHGSLLGGHYTSFAKCFGDEANQSIGWRYFDDTEVTKCNESNVVTSCAYVLFYKRREKFQPSTLDHHSIGFSIQDINSGKKDMLDGSFQPLPTSPKLFLPNYDCSTSQPTQLLSKNLKSASLISHEASTSDCVAFQPEDNLAALLLYQSDFEILK